MKTKIVSCHIADSQPVKMEVNGTVILPPLVFPDFTIKINVKINKFKWYKFLLLFYLYFKNDILNLGKVRCYKNVNKMEIIIVHIHN